VTTKKKCFISRTIMEN